MNNEEGGSSNLLGQQEKGENQSPGARENMDSIVQKSLDMGEGGGGGSGEATPPEYGGLSP